jgi:hypothetical protein
MLWKVRFVLPVNITLELMILCIMSFLTAIAVCANVATLVLTVVRSRPELPIRFKVATLARLNTATLLIVAISDNAVALKRITTADLLTVPAKPSAAETTLKKDLAPKAEADMAIEAVVCLMNAPTLWAVAATVTVIEANRVTIMPRAVFPTIVKVADATAISPDSISAVP